MQATLFRLVLAILLFTSWANISYGSGGHAHFGRSRFVNGGVATGQVSNLLAEIEVKTHSIGELIQAGNLLEIEELAISIRDLSFGIADNTTMDRVRNAKLKRVSKGISRAAKKLKKYAVVGDASKAKQQVERIHKLLEFVA